MRLLISAVFLALALANPANAQQAPTPCSAPEHRQLDFWLGVWDVSWDDANGIPAGQGTNTITRQLGDCVIQEDFDGGPSTGDLIGRSVSLYHAPLGQWRQTWVDNQGGYFALTGGPDGDAFILNNARVSENAPHRRMVFEDITETSLTWRWQGSSDGAAWNDLWVIRYTRRP